MFELTLHRLRIYKSVVETGSFNAAALKLNITQPSISSHIKALEQEIGHPLFTRAAGRKSELTQAGKMVYSYSQEVISQTEILAQNLGKLSREKQQVTLSVQPHIANNLLPKHLTSFSKKHIHINLHLYSQTLDVIIEHVQTGKAELGLVSSNQNIDGMNSEVLSNIEMVFFVAPTHELAKRKSINPKELEQYAFVGGVASSHHSNSTRLLLKKMGITHYNVIMQLEDYKTIIEVVKQGLGIGILSKYNVTEELKKGHLVQLPIKAEPIMVQLKFIYNEKRTLSKEARLFMNFVKGEMVLV